MRTRQRSWVLFFRKEKGNVVYLYDQFRKKQISNMLRHGWEIEMKG